MQKANETKMLLKNQTSFSNINEVVNNAIANDSLPLVQFKIDRSIVEQ